MNKATILALITGACLLIKIIFGFEIGTEDQDTLAEMVLAGYTLYGVTKDPKKKDIQ